MTGVKMSWVTLDRIVSEEALRDEADRAEPALPVRKREEVQEMLRRPGAKLITGDPV